LSPNAQADTTAALTRDPPRNAPPALRVAVRLDAAAQPGDLVGALATVLLERARRRVTATKT
jgi:hypothetical protein